MDVNVRPIVIYQKYRPMVSKLYADSRSIIFSERLMSVLQLLTHVQSSMDIHICLKHLLNLGTLRGLCLNISEYE